MVFNAFILMTLFNKVNCRRVHGERNVFEHLTSNPLFIGIWLTSLALQVLIVQTPGLGPKVVIFIPTSSPKSDKIPNKRGKHRTMSVEMEKMGEPSMKARGTSQESRPQQ